MKNFSEAKWIDILATKDWNVCDNNSVSVEDMAVSFNKNIDEALDEIAPYESFADLKAIQIVQNKLARILNGVKLSEKISSKALLSKLKMLPVNQINAQAKLLDMWKATHVEGNPPYKQKNNKKVWLNT